MTQLNKSERNADVRNAPHKAPWPHGQACSRRHGRLPKAALADGAIPKKCSELMAIAGVLTTQCPYCLDVHRKAAQAAGATPEELAETVFVATALRAGAAYTHGSHLFPE
jgi:AhpD family alkylhydroperoxidase